MKSPASTKAAYTASFTSIVIVVYAHRIFFLYFFSACAFFLLLFFLSLHRYRDEGRKIEFNSHSQLFRSILFLHFLFPFPLFLFPFSSSCLFFPSFFGCAFATAAVLCRISLLHNSSSSSLELAVTKKPLCKCQSPFSVRLTFTTSAQRKRTNPRALEEKEKIIFVTF